MVQELRGILRRLGRGPSDQEFLVALELTHKPHLAEVQISFGQFIKVFTILTSCLVQC